MKKTYKEWEKEFFQLDLRDKRLKNRFFQMMDSLSNSPDQSILFVTGSRVSAKAAYRFFANETVSYKQLLESISRTTVEKLLQIQTTKLLLI